MNGRRLFTKTKILVTLGPSSSDKKILRSILDLGVSTFRLNFSHGTHQEHGDQIRTIRELERMVERPLGIMVDLQGRKIRLGLFKEGSIYVNKGDVFTLDLDPTPGDIRRVCLPFAEIFPMLKVGDPVLIDDGKVSFRIIHTSLNQIKMQALQEGTLSDHKGVSFPGKLLRSPVLTAKDREDLEFALDQDIDWVAISYIQNAQEVQDVKDITGAKVGVIAKIEHPGAVEDLDAILSYSDGVMVARGDLGLEMAPEEVPCAQRKIVHQARLAGKPVIIATQMLESMISSPTPTRAEVSDVAIAVYQGADAVMLSAETANGLWPIQSVEMMARVIKRTQEDPIYQEPTLSSKDTICEAISQCAHLVTQRVECKIIVSFTESGATAKDVASHRPGVPILALTPFVKVARKLALVWGIWPRVVRRLDRWKDLEAQGIRMAVQEEFCKSGDLLVLTSGFPLSTSGSTSLLRILTA